MSDFLELLDLLGRALFLFVLFWALLSTIISTLYFFYKTLIFVLAHRKHPP